MIRGRKKQGGSQFRKTLSILLLVYLLLMTLLPLQAFAAGPGGPPERPCEKMIVKKASWYSSQMDYEGSKSLLVGYRGSFDKPISDLFFTFDVKETTVLTGVYIPFKGLLQEASEMALVSESGNIYQGFGANIQYVNTLREAPNPGQEPDLDQEDEEGYPESAGPIMLDEKGNTIVYYQPEDAIVLPKGRYMIQLGGGAWPADGYFVKGMDFKAYEKYKQDLAKWLGDEDQEILGNKELGENFWERAVADLLEEPAWMDEEFLYRVPEFELEEAYIIEEIILSTWNSGQGAKPGIIYLFDEEGDLVDAFQSQGYGNENEPNTFWVVMPEIILPAGTYFLDIEDKWALDFDEEGDPMFAISVSPAPDEDVVFTGTYRINLDLYLTRTLMGAVDPPENKFKLRHHEIAVIDKGEFIEIIGKYEGMPFSQNCPVIDRGQDYATVTLNFATDLTGLPFKAKIAAIGEIHFSEDSNGRNHVSADGSAYYDREATKEKGADSNSYEMQVKGSMVKEELPPFVMVAIAQAYGVGNIPGPGSPAEAAVGMLFPPLVGLLANSISAALRRETEEAAKAAKALKPRSSEGGLGGLEPNPNLSVGEQAMMSSNHSMADMLVSEREREAWKIYADALGATGGDADDPFSIGDNEIRDAKAAAAGERKGGVFGGYDDDYDLPDEYTGSQDYTREPTPQADDSRQVGPGPSEPTSDLGGAYIEEYESPTPYTIYGAPKTITLVTNHEGRTNTYVQDPKTGEYINEMTGDLLDTEIYEKSVKPSFDADREFAERARRENLERSWLSRQVEAEEAARKAGWAQEDHIRRMQDKYGLETVKELNEFIAKRNETQIKVAEAWENAAFWAGVGEKAASVTVVAADVALDGLEQVTGPVGKGINIAYKGVKNVASTMAEDGVSWESAARGAIKGGADIAGGFINNPYYKAAVTIGAETVQSAIKDGKEGAAKGFVEGAINAVVGESLDRMAGSGFGKEVSTFAVGRGKVRVAVNTGDKWVGRTVSKKVAETFVKNKQTALKKQVAVKLAGGLVNEFGLKPTISDPIVDAAGGAFKVPKSK